MNKLYIPIILGTAREGRQSVKVANFALEQVEAAQIESQIIDVRDFRISATDNTQKSDKARQLEEKIERADAIIIVTPEYNSGYPGELKMMLDLLYQQYFGKPVGFCGVSSGFLGGARVIEQLKLVSIELHMLPIREAVHFGNVTNLFNAKGKIKDKTYSERFKVFLDQLVSYANIIKDNR